MGWMLVILGAVMALMAGRQVAGLFTASDGWLPVSATVVRSRVAPVGTVTLKTAANGARHNPQGQNTRSGQEHHVYQELVYFVNGNRYSAFLDRGQFGSRADALSAMAQIESSGSQVSVWANVNDFEQVVMQPVQREAGAGAIAVFALLGLFALQLGSTLVRSASSTAATPAASPSPLHSRPITIH